MNSQQFDDAAYYESVTRQVRWLAILITAAACPPGTPEALAVFGLVVLASGYNALRLSPLMNFDWFSSKLNMLVTDNLFVVVLMGLTGGARSPFVMMFIFMLISSTYWYGFRGLSAQSVFQILAWLGLSWVPTPVLPNGSLRQDLLKVLVLLVIGWHVERFTNAERRKRQIETGLYSEIVTERRRLLALINSLSEAVVAVDAGGLITQTNGTALDLLNTNKSMVGKPISELLHLLDTGGQVVDILAESRKAKSEQHRSDVHIKAADGSDMKIDVVTAPIISQSGKPADGGYIILMRDITREKTLDEERDEFISVTSHELKTPLAIAEATLSTAMLPAAGRADEAVRQMIGQAHQEVVYLGALVRDLTTLSRAERGILAVDLSLVDPAKLLSDIEADFRQRVEERGLALKVETASGLKPLVTSQFHVREALTNLLTNSMKYTEKGGITLKAEPASDGRGVVFCVSDTGIGISASDQKKLFTKFFQSEDFHTRTAGGTGLGLYITRKLAERLGAKIWFSSRLGKGSDFFLEVPPSATAPQDQKQVVDVQIDNFVSTI